LKRRPIEYFKMLYADTAVNGEGAATRCGHAFFGSGHSLFATDAPFDAEQGHGLIRDTSAAVGTGSCRTNAPHVRSVRTPRPTSCRNESEITA
jgi:hypothetical protein